MPVVILFLFAATAWSAIGGCSDDKPGSSTFGRTDAGSDASSSSSGGFKPSGPDCQGQSAAAPAVPLCSDAGTPDAAPKCEDDLATCQRVCQTLLNGYEYCGVDDGTDGGRVVRCTIAPKPCGG
jgi:hypothetical protein